MDGCGGSSLTVDADRSVLPGEFDDAVDCIDIFGDPQLTNFLDQTYVKFG